MEDGAADPVGETQGTYDLITAEFARQNASAWPDLADNIDVLTASVRPGSVVADVGCGPGRDTALLRAEGFRVVGMDLSFGQLRTGGLTSVVQGDMRRLPLRAGSVDAIWCNAALLHIPRTVVPTVLAEFASVTRPGGELFLAVVEGDGEGFQAASKYGSDGRRWFTLHREPDLTALLADAGFAVHQMRRTHGRRIWLCLHARRACEPVARH